MLSKLKSKLNNDSNLKELVSGSAITFVLKMLGMLLSYLVVYLIAKNKGASGVGYYSIINGTLLILGVIAVMGTNTSILRYVGKFNSENERSKLKTTYFNSIKIALPFAMLFAVLIHLYAHDLSWGFSKSYRYTRALEWISYVLPLFTISLINIEFLRGLKKLKVSEFIRSVSRPIVLAASMIAFTSDSFETFFIVLFICAGEVVNFLISSIAVLIQLLKVDYSAPSKGEAPGYRKLFKVSSPMMITMITGTLMSTMSLFILEQFNSAEDVGVYSVAFRITQLIAIVLLVVNTIAAPKFSELYWHDKHDELQKVMNQSVKLMFWGALILSIIIGVSSAFLLDIFGEGFVRGQKALLILIAGQLINAATGSVSLFMNMSGHQNALRNLVLIALVIQIVLSFTLIPAYGLIGAAIATSAGSIIRNLLCILYVKQKLNFKTYYFPKL